MTCENCANWVRERRWHYTNGDEVVKYTAPEGKGLCPLLPLETPPHFHCSLFVEGADHIKVERVDGAPWQYWEMGACPDCGGRGCTVDGGVCQRCVGTSKVRFYADGYVGEERTRRHPKEPPEAQSAPQEMLVKPKPDILGVGG